MKLENSRKLLLAGILILLVISSGFVLVRLIVSTTKSASVVEDNEVASSGTISSFPNFARVDEKKFSTSDYIVGLGISKDSEWRKAKMIQIRGKVFEIDEALQFMTIKMLELKLPILLPQGTIRLLCEPVNYQDVDGNLVASNQVYLDLKKTYTTTGVEKSVEEVAGKFFLGGDIIVVAERVNNDLVARLVVGYGCSL